MKRILLIFLLFFVSCATYHNVQQGAPLAHVVMDNAVQVESIDGQKAKLPFGLLEKDYAVAAGTHKFLLRYRLSSMLEFYGEISQDFQAGKKYRIYPDWTKKSFNIIELQQ